MNDSTLQRGWRIVPAAAGGLTVAAMVASFVWFPGLFVLAVLVSIALMGVTFVWVYAIDPTTHWWAIIPGMGVLTILAAVFAQALVGLDPSYDWLPLLIVAGGAVLTAAVSEHDTATFALSVVAGLAFMLAVALMPLVIPAKAALWAAVPGVATQALWRRQRTRVEAAPTTARAGRTRSSDAAGTLG